MHVWGLGLSCETPAALGPPGTKARETPFGPKGGLNPSLVRTPFEPLRRGPPSNQWYHIQGLPRRAGAEGGGEGRFVGRLCKVVELRHRGFAPSHALVRVVADLMHSRCQEGKGSMGPRPRCTRTHRTPQVCPRPWRRAHCAAEAPDVCESDRDGGLEIGGDPGHSRGDERGLVECLVSPSRRRWVRRWNSWMQSRPGAWRRGLRPTSPTRRRWARKLEKRTRLRLRARHVCNLTG